MADNESSRFSCPRENRIASCLKMADLASTSWKLPSRPVEEVATTEADHEVDVAACDVERLFGPDLSVGEHRHFRKRQDVVVIE